MGSLIIVRRRAADDAHLMRHERVHVVQWRSLGLVALAVGVLSLIAAAAYFAIGDYAADLWTSFTDHQGLVW